VSLLKRSGIFSCIVANKWMRANYGEPLRRWMKQWRIEEIVDFGDLPVFQRVTTYPCIVRITNGSPSRTFHATQVKTLDFQSLHDYVREEQHTVIQSSLDNNSWSLVDKHTQELLYKLKDVGISLGEYVKGKIYRGVLTGLNEAFVINKETRNKLIAEDRKSAELIKPFLFGRDIKRYDTPSIDRYLILIPKGWTSSHVKNSTNAWNWVQGMYPSIAKYLLPFKEAAQKRYDKGEYWWELRACDYYAEFEKQKIILPSIAQRASCAFDKRAFFSNDKTTIISTNDLFLLGVLNSKALDFVIHSISSTKQGGYFEYKPMYVNQLPIRTIDFSNPKDKVRHDKMVKLVERMLDLNKKLQKARTEHDKTVLKRQIDSTDTQIDNLVYELYGLTKKEIAIVEESVK
ncbi:MAG: TaqI-like C-terminal specificity domain-containing protein, partial [Candidatus Bathyanammoxibius sp.]